MRLDIMFPSVHELGSGHPGAGSRTHSTGHRPEGGKPLSRVGCVATPGIPGRVLAPLQHVLLPLKASMLKAHPPVDRQGRNGKKEELPT